MVGQRLWKERDRVDIETILTIIVERALAPKPGDLGLLHIKSFSKLFSAQLPTPPQSILSLSLDSPGGAFPLVGSVFPPVSVVNHPLIIRCTHLQGFVRIKGKISRNVNSSVQEGHKPTPTAPRLQQAMLVPRSILAPWRPPGDPSPSTRHTA